MDAVIREMSALQLQDMGQAGMAEIHVRLGIFHNAVGRFLEAVAEWEEGLGIWRELGARIQVADLMGWLSATLQHLGQRRAGALLGRGCAKPGARDRLPARCCECPYRIGMGGAGGGALRRRRSGWLRRIWRCR